MHHFNGFALLILFFIVWLITRPDRSEPQVSKDRDYMESWERGFRAGTRWATDRE